MALMEQDKGAARSASGGRSNAVHDETTAAASPASADGAGQDEQTWDAAIANSLDVIREMADKARAERRAGRTKKVTL